MKTFDAQLVSKSDRTDIHDCEVKAKNLPEAEALAAKYAKENDLFVLVVHLRPNKRGSITRLS